jgi:hypothetical protein
MGAGLLAVKSGFILFIKNYQFPIQINTLEREMPPISQESNAALTFIYQKRRNTKAQGKLN